MTKRKLKKWAPREAQPVRFKDPKTGKYLKRALMWKKEVYIEWFEYAKYAQSLGYKTPVEFGDLSTFKKFNDWWHIKNFFAADLFMEPEFGRAIKQVDYENYDNSPNKLLFEIDLSRSYNQIKFDFRLLMDEEISTSQKYIPVAKFQPSKPMKELRLKHAEHEKNEKKDLPIRLNNPRLVHKMTNEGLKQTEIAYKLKFFEGMATVKDKEADTVDYVMLTNDEVYQWKKETTGRGNTNKEVHGGLKDTACKIRYDSAIRRVNRNLRQCEQIFKSIEKGTFP